MIKLTACILIISAGALWGSYMSSRLRRRTSLLREAVSMISSISGLIRYQKSTTDEIMASLRCREEHRTLTEQSCPWLREEEKRLLREIFSSLGSTDSEGQRAMLELYAGRFKDLAESAAAEQQQKCRLYDTLGFMLGAFIAILIV